MKHYDYHHQSRTGDYNPKGSWDKSPEQRTKEKKDANPPHRKTA